MNNKTTHAGTKKRGLFVLVIFILIVFLLLILDFLIQKHEGFVFIPLPGKIWALGASVNYSPDINTNKISWPKKTGDFNIFALGDSTCAGYPWGPNVSFSYLLTMALKQLKPQVHFQCWNISRNGIYSKDILLGVKRTLKYKPDLVIIYVGNNELFHFVDVKNKRYPGERFINEIYKLIKPQAAKKKFLADVWEVYKSKQYLSSFRKNLLQIKQLCADLNIPLLVIIPGTNLEIAASQIASFYPEVETTVAGIFSSPQTSNSSETTRNILKLFEKYPIFYANRELEKLIKAECGAQTVDFQAYLTNESYPNIVGYNFFLDKYHPLIETQKKLAILILRQYGQQKFNLTETDIEKSQGLLNNYIDNLDPAWYLKPFKIIRKKSSQNLEQFLADSFKQEQCWEFFKFSERYYRRKNRKAEADKYFLQGQKLAKPERRATSASPHLH